MRQQCCWWAIKTIKCNCTNSPLTQHVFLVCIYCTVRVLAGTSQDLVQNACSCFYHNLGVFCHYLLVTLTVTVTVTNSENANEFYIWSNILNRFLSPSLCSQGHLTKWLIIHNEHRERGMGNSVLHSPQQTSIAVRTGAPSASFVLAHCLTLLSDILIFTHQS